MSGEGRAGRWWRLGRVTAEGCVGSGAGCAGGSRASPPPGFDRELFQELSFLPDAELRECLGEYPDFLYHVARDKFGRLYFRVIRTLLLDRGTVILSSRLIISVLSFSQILKKFLILFKIAFSFIIHLLLQLHSLINKHVKLLCLMCHTFMLYGFVILTNA